MEKDENPGIQSLPEEVLNRRLSLPTKPEPVTLTGDFVELRPIDLERDVERLYAISCGNEVTLHGKTFPKYYPEELIWRYMPYGPFRQASDLASLINANSSIHDTRILVVMSRVEQDLIGLATYMNNSPSNLKVEIGGIWFTPAVQGTIFTKEALFLMIEHALQIGYRRVEWKCDATNMKSRTSAVSLGFTFEGIQQAHMIIKNRNRDTAWYRILADEWPEIKSRTLDHLARSKRNLLQQTVRSL